MKLLDYIPYGRENAITRSNLCKVSELDDRVVRERIGQLRRDNVILNLQDGSGYFRPLLPDESELVERFVKQETKRLKSIGWSLKAARRAVKNSGT